MNIELYYNIQRKARDNEKIHEGISMSLGSKEEKGGELPEEMKG